MSRYRDLKQQGWSWKLVELPLVNKSHGIQQGTPEQAAQWEADGKPESPVLGIRALGPEEDLFTHEWAAAYSKEHGVAEYDERNPVCLLAHRHYTLAMACVDPESDPRRPLLFFGDNPEEAAETLRKDPKHAITPDIVDYLYEQYEVWKDKVNPQALSLGDMSLSAAAEKAAENADFLTYFRPGALVTFTACMAVQYTSLLAERSGITSGCSSAPKTKKPSSARKPAAKTSRSSKKSKRR